MTESGQKEPTAKTHQILAQKYRPQKFADVVEQDTAVQALGNAFRENILGTAYLFFGTRGVGKTTIARIAAKRVNCHNPQGNEPCNECESCVSITSGHSMDVIEIDAASNRGIQNIRELRESVKFQPMNSHKKVYIIDEVHMLTAEAFNALLKTLEEPPPHVLFILATTELNKIPETILSRCQVFIFRRVPLVKLQEHLASICKKENIAADDEALFWIARKGDGSVRDSLSFLETVITYSGKKVTAQTVKEITGVVWFDTYLRLTEALLQPESSSSEILEPIRSIFSVGGDLSRFAWDFVDFLRIAIHVKNGIEDPEFLGVPDSEISSIRKALSDSDPVRIQIIFDGIYNLIHRAGVLRLRNSYESRVLIEVELYSIKEKLSRPSLSSVIHKINKLSSALREGIPYSPENDIQEKFLGTVVDPETVPRV